MNTQYMIIKETDKTYIVKNMDTDEVEEICKNKVIEDTKPHLQTNIYSDDEQFLFI